MLDDAEALLFKKHLPFGELPLDNSEEPTEQQVKTRLAVLFEPLKELVSWCSVLPNWVHFCFIL